MSPSKLLAAAFCLATVTTSTTFANSKWSCKGATSILEEQVELVVDIDGERNLTSVLSIEYTKNDVLRKPLASSKSKASMRTAAYDFSLLDPRFGIIVSYDIKLVFSDFTKKVAKAVVVSKHLDLCLDGSGKVIDINNSHYDINKIDTKNCSELTAVVNTVGCVKVTP